MRPLTCSSLIHFALLIRASYRDVEYCTRHYCICEQIDYRAETSIGTNVLPWLAIELARSARLLCHWHQPIFKSRIHWFGSTTIQAQRCHSYQNTETKLIKIWKLIPALSRGLEHRFTNTSLRTSEETHGKLCEADGSLAINWVSMSER